MDKHEFDDEPTEAINVNGESINKNDRKLLSDVEEVLRDEEKRKEIMSKYEKGRTKEEYNENRGKELICY